MWCFDDGSGIDEDTACILKIHIFFALCEMIEMEIAWIILI